MAGEIKKAEAAQLTSCAALIFVYRICPLPLMMYL